MGCSIPAKSISAEHRCTAACALTTWHKEHGYKTCIHVHKNLEFSLQMSLYIHFFVTGDLMDLPSVLRCDLYVSELHTRML